MSRGLSLALCICLLITSCPDLFSEQKSSVEELRKLRSSIETALSDIEERRAEAAALPLHYPAEGCYQQDRLKRGLNQAIGNLQTGRLAALERAYSVQGDAAERFQMAAENAERNISAWSKAASIHLILASYGDPAALEQVRAYCGAEAPAEKPLPERLDKSSRELKAAFAEMNRSLEGLAAAGEPVLDWLAMAANAVSEAGKDPREAKKQRLDNLRESLAGLDEDRQKRIREEMEELGKILEDLERTRGRKSFDAARGRIERTLERLKKDFGRDPAATEAVAALHNEYKRMLGPSSSELHQSREPEPVKAPEKKDTEEPDWNRQSRERMFILAAVGAEICAMAPGAWNSSVERCRNWVDRQNYRWAASQNLSEEEKKSLVLQGLRLGVNAPGTRFSAEEAGFKDLPKGAFVVAGPDKTFTLSYSKDKTKVEQLMGPDLKPLRIRTLEGEGENSSEEILAFENGKLIGITRNEGERRRLFQNGQELSDSLIARFSTRITGDLDSRGRLREGIIEDGGDAVVELKIQKDKNGRLIQRKRVKAKETSYEFFDAEEEFELIPALETEEEALQLADGSWVKPKKMPRKNFRDENGELSAIELGPELQGTALEDAVDFKGMGFVDDLSRPGLHQWLKRTGIRSEKTFVDVKGKTITMISHGGAKQHEIQFYPKQGMFEVITYDLERDAKGAVQKQLSLGSKMYLYYNNGMERKVHEWSQDEAGKTKGWAITTEHLVNGDYQPEIWPDTKKPKTIWWEGYRAKSSAASTFVFRPVHAHEGVVAGFSGGFEALQKWEPYDYFQSGLGRLANTAGGALQTVSSSILDGGPNNYEGVEMAINMRLSQGKGLQRMEAGLMQSSSMDTGDYAQSDSGIAQAAVKEVLKKCGTLEGASRQECEKHVQSYLNYKVDDYIRHVKWDTETQFLNDPAGQGWRGLLKRVRKGGRYEIVPVIDNHPKAMALIDQMNRVKNDLESQILKAHHSGQLLQDAAFTKWLVHQGGGLEGSLVLIEREVGSALAGGLRFAIAGGEMAAMSGPFSLIVRGGKYLEAIGKAKSVTAAGKAGHFMARAGGGVVKVGEKADDLSDLLEMAYAAGQGDFTGALQASLMKAGTFGNKTPRAQFNAEANQIRSEMKRLMDLKEQASTDEMKRLEEMIDKSRKNLEEIGQKQGLERRDLLNQYALEKQYAKFLAGKEFAEPDTRLDVVKAAKQHQWHENFESDAKRVEQNLKALEASGSLNAKTLSFSHGRLSDLKRAMDLLVEEGERPSQQAQARLAQLSARLGLLVEKHALPDFQKQAKALENEMEKLESQQGVLPDAALLALGKKYQELGLFYGDTMEMYGHPEAGKVYDDLTARFEALSDRVGRDPKQGIDKAVANANQKALEMNGALDKAAAQAEVIENATPVTALVDRQGRIVGFGQGPQRAFFSDEMNKKLDEGELVRVVMNLRALDGGLIDQAKVYGALSPGAREAVRAAMFERNQRIVQDHPEFKAAWREMAKSEPTRELTRLLNKIEDFFGLKPDDPVAFLTAEPREVKLPDARFSNLDEIKKIFGDNPAVMEGEPLGGSGNAKKVDLGDKGVWAVKSWNAKTDHGVYRAQNELVMREVLKEFFPEFEISEAVAYRDGDQIVVMSRFRDGVKPDEAKFLSLDPQARAKLAVLSEIFGLEDMNSDNIQFGSSGKPYLLDFAQMERESFQDGSMAEPRIRNKQAPFLDLEKFNDPSLYLAEHAGWVKKFNDPQFIQKLSALMERSGMSAAEIKKYIAALHANVKNFPQNINAYLEIANAKHSADLVAAIAKDKAPIPDEPGGKLFKGPPEWNLSRAANIFDDLIPLNPDFMSKDDAIEAYREEYGYYLKRNKLQSSRYSFERYSRDAQEANDIFRDLELDIREMAAEGRTISRQEFIKRIKEAANNPVMEDIVRRFEERLDKKTPEEQGKHYRAKLREKSEHSTRRQIEKEMERAEKAPGGRRGNIRGAPDFGNSSKQKGMDCAAQALYRLLSPYAHSLGIEYVDFLNLLRWHLKDSSIGTAEGIDHGQIMDFLAYLGIETRRVLVEDPKQFSKFKGLTLASIATGNRHLVVLDGAIRGEDGEWTEYVRDSNLRGRKMGWSREELIEQGLIAINAHVQDGNVTRNKLKEMFENYQRAVEGKVYEPVRNEREIELRYSVHKAEESLDNWERIEKLESDVRNKTGLGSLPIGRDILASNYKGKSAKIYESLAYLEQLRSQFKEPWAQKKVNDAIRRVFELYKKSVAGEARILEGKEQRNGEETQRLELLKKKIASMEKGPDEQLAALKKLREGSDHLLDDIFGGDKKKKSGKIRDGALVDDDTPASERPLKESADKAVEAQQRFRYRQFSTQGADGVEYYWHSYETDRSKPLLEAYGLPRLYFRTVSSPDLKKLGGLVAQASRDSGVPVQFKYLSAQTQKINEVFAGPASQFVITFQNLNDAKKFDEALSRELDAKGLRGIIAPANTGGFPVSSGGEFRTGYREEGAGKPQEFEKLWNSKIPSDTDSDSPKNFWKQIDEKRQARAIPKSTVKVEKLGEKLGEGGTAEVFEAEIMAGGERKTAALKLPLPGMEKFIENGEKLDTLAGLMDEGGVRAAVPEYFGAASFNGRSGYAMEKVENVTPLRAVRMGIYTPETRAQIEAAARVLMEKGYLYADLMSNYRVLAKDQVIRGEARRKGDIVLVDPDALTRSTPEISRERLGGELKTHLKILDSDFARNEITGRLAREYGISREKLVSIEVGIQDELMFTANDKQWESVFRQSIQREMEKERGRGISISGNKVVEIGGSHLLQGEQRLNLPMRESLVFLAGDPEAKNVVQVERIAEELIRVSEPDGRIRMAHPGDFLEIASLKLSFDGATLGVQDSSKQGVRVADRLSSLSFSLGDKAHPLKEMHEFAEDRLKYGSSESKQKILNDAIEKLRTSGLSKEKKRIEMAAFFSSLKERKLIEPWRAGLGQKGDLYWRNEESGPWWRYDPASNSMVQADSKGPAFEEHKSPIPENDYSTGESSWDLDRAMNILDKLMPLETEGGTLQERVDRAHEYGDFLMRHNLIPADYPPDQYAKHVKEVWEKYLVFQDKVFESSEQDGDWTRDKYLKELKKISRNPVMKDILKQFEKSLDKKTPDEQSAYYFQKINSGEDRATRGQIEKEMKRAENMPGGREFNIRGAPEFGSLSSLQQGSDCAVQAMYRILGPYAKSLDIEYMDFFNMLRWKLGDNTIGMGTGIHFGQTLGFLSALEIEAKNMKVEHPDQFNSFQGLTLGSIQGANGRHMIVLDGAVRGADGQWTEYIRDSNLKARKSAWSRQDLIDQDLSAVQARIRDGVLTRAKLKEMWNEYQQAVLRKEYVPVSGEAELGLGNKLSEIQEPFSRDWHKIESLAAEVENKTGYGATSMARDSLIRRYRAKVSEGISSLNEMDQMRSDYREPWAEARIQESLNEMYPLYKKAVEGEISALEGKENLKKEDKSRLDYLKEENQRLAGGLESYLKYLQGNRRLLDHIFNAGEKKKEARIEGDGALVPDRTQRPVSPSRMFKNPAQLKAALGIDLSELKRKQWIKPEKVELLEAPDGKLFVRKWVGMEEAGNAIALNEILQDDFFNKKLAAPEAAAYQDGDRLYLLMEHAGSEGPVKLPLESRAKLLAVMTGTGLGDRDYGNLTFKNSRMYLIDPDPSFGKVDVNEDAGYWDAVNGKAFWASMEEPNSYQAYGPHIEAFKKKFSDPVYLESLRDRLEARGISSDGTERIIRSMYENAGTMEKNARLLLEGAERYRQKIRGPDFDRGNPRMKGPNDSEDFAVRMDPEGKGALERQKIIREIFEDAQYRVSRDEILKKSKAARRENVLGVPAWGSILEQKGTDCASQAAYDILRVHFESLYPKDRYPDREGLRSKAYIDFLNMFSYHINRPNLAVGQGANMEEVKVFFERAGVSVKITEIEKAEQMAGLNIPALTAVNVGRRVKIKGQEQENSHAVVLSGAIRESGRWTWYLDDPNASSRGPEGPFKFAIPEEQLLKLYPTVLEAKIEDFQKTARALSQMKNEYEAALAQGSYKRPFLSETDLAWRHSFKPSSDLTLKAQVKHEARYRQLPERFETDEEYLDIAKQIRRDLIFDIKEGERQISLLEDQLKKAASAEERILREQIKNQIKDVKDAVAKMRDLRKRLEKL